MSKCGIYKYTNLINGKSYIGQAIDIGQRIREHRSDASCRPDKGSSYFHKALRKYGEENFSFEILEECAKEELDEREIYWIKYYHTYIKDVDNNGYNLTPGGKSGQGVTSRKPVLQYDLDGNFIQEYESASEAARQLNLFKSNLTAACRGETSQCGKYQWKYKDDNNREIKPIPAANGDFVYQYDKQMNFIKRYASAVAAEKETGIKAGNIRSCCNGRSKTAGGFVWRRKELGKENG